MSPANASTQAPVAGADYAESLVAPSLEGEATSGSANSPQSAGAEAQAITAEKAKPAGFWRSLLATTRPSVVGLVFFTGLPALAIDDGVWPGWAQSTMILAGIALAASASSVFNAWIERDRDKLMERTAQRPLPTGAVTPQQALIWAWFLTISGCALLYASGGWQGALAGALTIAFYVFGYTIWLKPRTPLNIVIGGAAGAAPPLIVDAALHGQIGLMSFTLFTIVFLWTPPHFWAISLFRKNEYQHAGFPMLPLTHGDDFTRLRMVQYATAIVPFAVLPALTRHLSVGYGAFAALVSGWFVWKCLQLYRKGGDKLARSTFFASLAYLHLLFTAMAIDLLVP